MLNSYLLLDRAIWDTKYSDCKIRKNNLSDADVAKWFLAQGNYPEQFKELAAAGYAPYSNTSIFELLVAGTKGYSRLNREDFAGPFWYSAKDDIFTYYRTHKLRKMPEHSLIYTIAKNSVHIFSFTRFDPELANNWHYEQWPISILIREF